MHSTPKQLEAAQQTAFLTLQAIQGLCRSTQAATKLLDAPDGSERFEARTLPDWRNLSRQAREYWAKAGFASETVEVAIADSLEPMRFEGESFLTAHEAVGWLGEWLADEWGSAMEWEVIEAKSGQSIPEHKRQRDCRRFAQKARNLSPEVIRSLYERLKIETAKAKRWVMDATRQSQPAPPPQPVSLQPEKQSKKRVTVDEANPLVREYLKKNASPARRVTVRELAKHIGCSNYTITKTAAWTAYNEKRRAREKPPKAVGFTKELEAVTGREDEELSRLIQEQEADMKMDEKQPREHKRV